MNQHALQRIFSSVRKTKDPAASSANQALTQLIRRGDRGFRFQSERHARCNADIDLLLDMEIAVWEGQEIFGLEVGGKILLNPSVERTLKAQ